MAQVIGLVNIAIDWTQQLYERCKRIKSNRDLCKKLQKDFVEIKEKLRELQTSAVTKATPDGSTSELSQLVSLTEDTETFQSSAWLAAMPDRWRNNLNELIGFFTNTNAILETLYSKSESTFKSFFRASKTQEELQKLLNDFEKLESRAWLLDNFGTIIEEIKNLAEKIEKRGILSVSQEIEFVPTFHVPGNPSGVIVNFDDTHTVESTLKRKVLDKSSTIVSAVGAKVASAVAATGMGGVGKTSALRAIGADKEVQNEYTGGVYFFTLGQNATSAEVIKIVAGAVENTRGVQVAERMRNEESVHIAIDKAATWFAGKRCLFICDDLWRTSSNPYGYFYDLKALIPSDSSSCMLISTRDLKLAEEIDSENQVYFSQRPDDVAEAMLCEYAGMGVEQHVRDSFNSILQYCGGLPIALAVAGRAVKRIAKRVREPSSAWSIFKERLDKDRHNPLGEKKAGGHFGIFHALSASLRGAADLQEFQHVCGEYSIQEIHRALCVLKKPVWAPYSMLAYLWKVTEGTAEKLAEEMESLSLANIEERNFRGKSVLGVKLHDFVHDFCVEEAQNGEGLVQWHSRLLEGYISRWQLSKQESEEGLGAYNWWSSKLENDNYLHSHLTYHLAESRRQEELESVVLDFRWTYRQLKVNGFLTLRDDFELFRTCQLSKKPETASEHSQGPYQHDEESHDMGSSCKSSSKDNNVDQDSANVADQTELIAVALRLSWPLLVSQESKFTQRELAFQMMGRLCSLRHKPAVDKYLRSVEREAEGPWAKPIGPCLELPQGQTDGKFSMPGPVTAVSVMHMMGFAVGGDNTGNLSIFNIKSMETVRTWRGHEGRVTSVAVSRDGQRIVSGSSDETVRIWNVETGDAVGEPLRGHTSTVESVAVSGDGQRIVSGSCDETVRIWNMETGKAIGEPLRGHKSKVTSVAVSGDGQRIVSGSSDKTVRVWVMETGEEIGEPLRGHENSVTLVAVSRDGQRVVSGSWDGTVRIWNMETGMAIGGPLRGHKFKVTSVALGGYGQRIVSWDEAVRIWNMETGKAIGEPLRGHGYSVTSVAVSGDGQRIVSGSWDGMVRIWNMETGKAIGEPLRGHRYWVASVAVSRDGQRVVSGSWDGTVRIWNMDTGEAIREPLRGHGPSITSVAVSGDGRRIVSGSGNGTVRIWNMETGKAIGEPLRGHGDWVSSVVVSGDGQRIVSGSGDGTVRIWNMDTGEAIGEPLRGHGEWVVSVAVSRDGRRIVSGSRDGTVRIWNMDTGEAIGEPLRGHENSVRSVAVSGDGQRIVSGSYDKTVRIWNMETGKAIGEPLRGHKSKVTSVAVSGDGQRIVSGSGDGTVRIWNMDTGEAIEEPLERDEDSVASVSTSGLLDEFIRKEPGNDGARGEVLSARSLNTRTFCITRRHGIFCGDITNGTGAMRIGSFESRVTAWLLDIEGKLWAGLANGTLAVVRTTK